MNNEEIQSLIEQLKAAGLGDEEIMDVFYETFKKGEMDREDLEVLAEAMGYELTDDFKNDPTPDPIASGELGDEGISKEDAEAAKEIAPGESAEEFKDKIEGEAPLAPEGDEEPKPEESDEDAEESEDAPAEGGDDAEPEKDSEESEDEEWEKAQKMFKI